MVDVLGHLVGAAGGVFSDQRRHMQQTHSVNHKDIHDPVVWPCVQTGVEAAAVKPAVAGADQGVVSFGRKALRPDAHFPGDALEHVDDQGHHIACGSADDGELAVLMDAGADAGVDAHRADIGAVPPVAVDQVNGVLPALHQGVQIPVHVLLVAKHAAEVVAGTGGEGADGHIRELGRAENALVESAVASTGVDPERPAGGGLLFYLFRGVHGGFGDVDLHVLIPAGKGFLHFFPDFAGPVFSSRGGVDDEQMFHGPYLT